ncbi:MAG: hypothetical protein ACREQN_07765 [Candidatus Binataceae bacterium]
MSTAAIAVPYGEYRYELRRGGDIVALEEERLAARALSGMRRSADGNNRHEVEVALDAGGMVEHLSLRYVRGLFNRNASYEAAEDVLRGSVSALAGRNEIAVKLGRFREVDGDLMLFKALIAARIRSRGQVHWTGRVAVIDPATLVAASIKHTWQRLDEHGHLWAFEPRMGDDEEIETDNDGRIVRRRDSRGVETVLTSFLPG